MPLSEWKETTLGEVIRTNQSTYSERENWSFINYLDTGNITENKIDNIQYLDTNIDKIPSRAKRKVKANDVVYSTVRPNQKHYGIITNPVENMLVSTGFVVIDGITEKIDNNFLYCYLTQEAITEYLQGIAENSTSTYPSIKPSDIETLQINLPPLYEQQAIAEVLGSLDDKIELNRQMNKTLEDMAQAIFKSWFVDSEEDFKQGKLVDDFNIVMGQSPAGNTYNEDKNGLPFYQGSRDFTYRYPSLRVWCSSPCRLANAGDTLMSVRAPVGALNMAIEKCCIGRGLCAIRHKSKSRSYTYYFMQNIVQKIASSSADGTVFDSINKITLENLDVIIPPVELINEFEEKVFELDEKIKANSMQIQTLVNLRDTLLPKLISGELRIPDAEKLVEELV